MPDEPLTAERLAAIRAHHTAVTDYAPAPWRWAGSVEAYRPIYYLATENHGRKWVMGASKAGFSGAELNFPVVSPETGWGLLAKGREIAVREQPYRDQIGDIDNPFAEYLKRAPEYVGELLAEVARLTALITAPDGGRIPLPLLDELQAIAAESGCHHQAAIAVAAETAYSVGAEHTEDLRAEVQRRGEANTLLATLHAEACRKVEAVLAAADNADLDEDNFLTTTQIREAIAGVAVTPTVQAEPADQLCSDKNGFHDGHEYRPAPEAGIAWCPGSPEPERTATPVVAEATQVEPPAYLSVDGVPYEHIPAAGAYWRMDTNRTDRPKFLTSPCGVVITRDLAERMAAGLPADEPTPEQRARFDAAPDAAPDAVPAAADSGVA